MKIVSLFLATRVAIMATITVLVVLATSCSSDPTPQAPPQVTIISPSSGPVNTSVAIAGINFSAILAENKVSFNGKEGVVTAATATQLTATVPLLAGTGPVSVVSKGLAATNQPIFTVALEFPEVSSLSPSSGYTNTSVIITGKNFSLVAAENKVTFNGKEAVVTLAAATQLTVTVPLLAVTGPVVVTVKGQTATNQPIFTVEFPEVSSLSPSSGYTNASVVITGKNFSLVLAENKVTFNGKEAVVTLATAAQLTVTVPLLAETGPVVVTVKGQTATNQPIFTVDFPEVSSLSQSSGYTNTSVLITGKNFSLVLAENKVTFNGKEAVVTVATATQLTVTVPLLAETGPVVVTVKGQTATNQPVFTVSEIDKIRLAIGTSLTSYDAAAANTWVNITAAEYDNLLNTVNGSSRYAMSEIFMNTSPPPNPAWQPGVTVGGNSNAASIPASSYIIAWSVRTGTDVSLSLGSKLKVGTSRNSGYIDYGSPLPDIGIIFKNARVYFALKTPNTTTPATPSYTAVYNKGNSFLGHNDAVGGSVPELYTSGDSPTLSLTAQRDSYSQVISTQIKEWK